jgi:transposase-like protein
MESAPTEHDLVSQVSKLTTCTKIGRQTFHPNAKPVGQQENGYPNGDEQKWRCPDCGKEWYEEIPQ